MTPKTTVKDAKACLNYLLEKLSQFNDSDEFVMELDDNCGGYYNSDLKEFVIFNLNNTVYCTNF